MGTGRKRSADPKSWKRNKVKKLRNLVFNYVNFHCIIFTASKSCIFISLFTQLFDKKK
jgi:hypothetical protein